jgi:hypothetical protein
MKSLTRRIIGAAMLGTSIVSPFVLGWSGVWRGRVVESHTYSTDSVTATSILYESHWPAWATVLLLGLAALGLLLLVLPAREASSR